MSNFRKILFGETESERISRLHQERESAWAAHREIEEYHAARARRPFWQKALGFLGTLIGIIGMIIVAAIVVFLNVLSHLAK